MIRQSIVALALTTLPAAAIEACDPGEVHLRGAYGATQFEVELADDPEERARGLMFREEMAVDAGMLFVYPGPQRVVFWMKNTLIPLDMIFLDANGVVKTIHHRAVPGDLSHIEGGTGIVAVLEINGGLADEIGLAVGDQMRHPSFGAGAAWPCVG